MSDPDTVTRAMGLVVYNALTRRKEPFFSIEDGHARMYVCGATVQDEPHLGHARSAVAFDVIRRTLLALGWRVTYVMNVTDIDDKIIARAVQEGCTTSEVAERYARMHEDALRTLQVLPPTVSPRATAHVADMVDLVATLVEQGAAYPVEGGDVYFSVERFEGYGKLSHRALEDMRAGERVEPDPRKRHPMDFALWKASKPGEPAWASPWGGGRPGWHIECSTMSMRYLGPTFDIHGGGMDLIFPHHENEIAQSEAATGKPFATFWLHNGFVTLDSEKMSKSEKHYVSAADVLHDYPAPVVRTFLVSGHYRSQIDFSPAALDDARGMWSRLASFARNASALVPDEGRNPPRLPGDSPSESSLWREKFMAAMCDDFNTPEALAALFDVVALGNALIARVERGGADGDSAGTELSDLLDTFQELAGILGLDPIGQWPDRDTARWAPVVEEMLAEREAARKVKDFERADRIRAVLAGAGIVVEDRAGGPRWYPGL